MVNSSQENYLVACLRPITVLVSLVMFTTIVVIIGLGVGVVGHFYGHAPNTAISHRTNRRENLSPLYDRRHVIRDIPLFHHWTFHDESLA